MNVFNRSITPTRRIEDIKKKVGNLLLIVRKCKSGAHTIMVNAKIKRVANRYIPSDGKRIPLSNICITTKSINE